MSWNPIKTVPKESLVWAKGDDDKNVVVLRGHEAIKQNYTAWQPLTPPQTSTEERREKIAIAAMQGMLSGQLYCSNYNGEMQPTSHELIADEALRFANALMISLNKAKLQ